MATVTTRTKDVCPLFGNVEDICPNEARQLPRYQEVIKCYHFVRKQIMGQRVKQPTSGEVANLVAWKIEDIWKRASLPILSHNRIKDMILAYNKNYQNIIKPLKSRNTPFLQEKLSKFKTASLKIFDICHCKCADFESCKCQNCHKVPKIEREFLKDQRTERKMVMGGIDQVKTRELRKKEERKQKTQQREAMENVSYELLPGASCSQSLNESNISLSSNESSTIASSDDDFISPKRQKKDKSPIQMRLALTSTARMADLTGSSNRTVAKIATAVLEDMKIVSINNKTNIIDKNKVRREINKNRKSLQHSADNKFIHGLYFDGRKDTTIIHKEGRRLTEKEEHISIIEEPGSKYFGHISLKASGSAEEIFQAMISHFIKCNTSLEKLIVLGGDGTNVNTGWKSGVFRKLEVHIGRPLQWSVCMLHMNELPLRHLLQELDGGTKGPNSFSGNLGKLLDGCENLPVVSFQPIITTLPVVSERDLSTDQQYLYKICCAISSGKCSANIAKRNPGRLNHARWLTTANRLLRLYVATNNPPENLEIITRFILKVYAPTWFHIKTNPFLQFGAIHLWTAIKAAREFSGEVKNIFEKVISKNGYFAHPENLLLAMLFDCRDNIRELAINRILIARQHLQNNVRYFKPPVILFNAEDYTDLIDWQACNLTEPPLTMELSEEYLKNCIHKKKMIEISVNFPCHTQAVERCVKVVTEASSKVCGETSRDGYIRAKFQGRNLLPKFENKMQYYEVKEANRMH